MADQQLNIKLNVIDNASKAFTQVKDSIFNVKNALIGLGTGVAFKTLVDIGRQAEEAKARLTSLTGSTAQGGRAFDQFTKFAINAKVPLEEVIASSKKLIALGASPEKLAKNLEIVSNISAQTGLSFETTVDQFAKATTKGLSNARVFADENIRILLGIPRGLEVSGKESARLFEREFSGSGRFGQANKNIKDTLSGTIIALRNIFFTFASEITTGFFGTLKRQLGDLEVFFNKNKKAISDFAQNLGEVLGTAIIIVGKALKLFVDNIEIFIAIFVGGQIYKAIDGIKKLAIAIGFLNVAFLTPIGIALGVIAGAIALIYTNSRNATEYTDKFKKSLEEIRDMRFGETYEGLDNVLNTEKTQKASEALKELDSNFMDFLTHMEQSQDPTFLERVKTQFEDINDVATDLAVTVAQGLAKAVGDVSKGIAESIVLGKSLQSTFKSIAQTILVDILTSQIKTLANLALQIVLEKAISQEKQVQAFYSSMGGGGGGGSFLSTIAKIGFNAFAGGGSVPLDAPNLYSPTFEAEGGAVRGGMPITVGERGRELFVPSTSGTIVPNHDMANTGTNITFNIQANDVRGIKELLIDNRATIINLVNQGANQKGKSNIV